MCRKIKFSSKLFLLALIFGIWAAYTVQQLLPLKPLWNLGWGLIAAAVFYLGLTLLGKLARKAADYINRTLDSIPSDILLGGIAGLFMGILVGVLSTFPLSLLDGIGDVLTLGIFCLSGLLGATIGARRAPDFIKLWPKKQTGT